LGYLFLGSPATLACEKSADADDGSEVDLTDAVYLLGYFYLGGPPPPPPFPACGPDPTADGLTCDVFPGC
jgi:hypothetical protein